LKKWKKFLWKIFTKIFRYYYNTKILLPVSGRRLVYRFGPNAVNWRIKGLFLGHTGTSSRYPNYSTSATTHDTTTGYADPNYSWPGPAQNFDTQSHEKFSSLQNMDHGDEHEDDASSSSDDI